MARKSRKHLQDAPVENKQLSTQKQYIAGIYARTSSKDQEGDSIENQVKIAEQFIQSNPDIQLYKTYSDYGFSSFARIRPSFEELLFDIETKMINCVVVKDISRLSREYIEAGDLLQKKFPLWGTRFISVGDDFDSLHSDATKTEIALRTLLYYSYSIDLSNKIQSVIKVRQETGEYVPARLPYGYVKMRNGNEISWHLEEKTAPIVQFMFEKAKNSISAYAIAGELNRQKTPAPSSEFWTSRGVLRILRNVLYTGTLAAGKTQNDRTAEFKTLPVPPENWIRHYNHHEPIVDEITFYTVQQLLSERRSPISTDNKVVDFFDGKLYCGMCGRKMRPKRAVNGNTYYICPRRDEAASSCLNRAKGESKLKQQVFLVLADKIKPQETVNYEKHPYYQRQLIEQETMLHKYEDDLEYQNQLFYKLYEEMASNTPAQSTDTRELMRYQRRVRNVLENQISDIIQSKAEHQANISSNVEKRRRYLWIQECKELTEEMISKIIKRIDVDFDGIRLTEN